MFDFSQSAKRHAIGYQPDTKERAAMWPKSPSSYSGWGSRIALSESYSTRWP
jgi:hypothetical protein